MNWCASQLDIGMSSFCGLQKPQLTSSAYSLRGMQNLHLYLWLLKDLSWAQNWYYSGMIFGSLAVSFSFLLMCNAIHMRATNEVFVTAATFIWIFANLWWMSADMLTYEPMDYPSHYDSRSSTARYMMLAGLCWLSFFYLIVKPFKLLDCDNEEILKLYDSSGLEARWPLFFDKWREYENIHVFCWLGKDFAWNSEFKSMWIIFVIPTLLISIDFVYVSIWHKPKAINSDLAHHISQLLWVLANIVWAGGELFDPHIDDKPYHLLDSSVAALRCPRWYTSWLLVLSFLPILSVALLKAQYSLDKSDSNERPIVRYKAVYKSYGTCASEQIPASDPESQNMLGVKVEESSSLPDS